MSAAQTPDVRAAEALERIADSLEYLGGVGRDLAQGQHLANRLYAFTRLSRETAQSRELYDEAMTAELECL